MTRQEVRTTISSLRTDIGRATTNRTKLFERLTGALSADRLDPQYVDNLRQQIARLDLDVENWAARIVALTPQLPSSEEVQHARIAVEDAASKGMAAHHAFPIAWSRFLAQLQSAAVLAEQVHAAKMTMLETRTRVDTFASEYGLNVERLPEPPTPDLHELKCARALAALLLTVADRQCSDDVTLIVVRDTLAEITQERTHA